MTTGEPTARVLVVDDAVVVRGLITNYLKDIQDVATVVASASNGQLAVNRVRQGDIDVVILDIEMPVMDGLTALPLMLEACPELIVIMASTLTTRNAEVTLLALKLGAKDFVPKPSSQSDLYRTDDFKRELLDKIQAFSGLATRRMRHVAKPAIGPASENIPPTLIQGLPRAGRPEIVAIGCSTGGPRALATLLKGINRCPAPILITQHMPPAFTALLAASLSQETGVNCKEAVAGEVVMPGRVYLAPGDNHMTIRRDGASVVVALDQGPKENFCRPAVDPMLRSIAAVYGPAALTVILTGMGQDGLQGARSIIACGGNVIAQDEESSVVWGMPGAVAGAGLCSAVMPLEHIASHVNALFGAHHQRSK